MKTNKQRLVLLLKFINIALGIILMSLIISVVYMIKGADKYAELPVQVANHNQFSKIGTVAVVYAYFNIFRVLAMKVLFAFIFLTMRKIIKSIINEEMFHADHVNQIRKIAKYFLYFTGIMVFFNISLVVAMYTGGVINSFKTVAASLKVAVFDSYLLAALIALGLIEVFVAGMKLKQEQELTI